MPGCRLAVHGRRPQARGGTQRGDADRHQLDLDAIVAIAVALLVSLGKRLAQCVGVRRAAVVGLRESIACGAQGSRHAARRPYCPRGRPSTRRAHRSCLHGPLLDRELERLPAVAQLVADADARGRLAELRARSCHERRALCEKALCVERLPGEHHSARRVAPGGRCGEAERAQHPGGARHEDPLHPQLPRQRCRVQGAGAAERHQREAAGVDPALHGYRAQRAQHLGLGDAHDSLRAALWRKAERGGEGGDRALGGVAVELQSAGRRASVEPQSARKWAVCG